LGLEVADMNTVQMHSILRRLFGYAKHKARTVASSGLGRVAWTDRILERVDRENIGHRSSSKIHAEAAATRLRINHSTLAQHGRTVPLHYGAKLLKSTARKTGTM